MKFDRSSHELPLRSHMYIDPGAGSVAFQILGAAAIAALSAISQVRATVRGWFSRLRRK